MHCTKTLYLLNLIAIVNLPISYCLLFFIYLTTVLVADARRRLVVE